MRLKDIIELIRVDMPDYTEGPFDIEIASDGGGNHIQISVEEHKDSLNILKTFIDRYKDQRILVLRVPRGYLKLKEKQ